MKSRREVLSTLAVLPASGRHGQHESDTTPPVAYSPKSLTQDEMDSLASLVEVIIPRTQTPGARDAGVHYFIDRVLSSRPSQLLIFRKGLHGVQTSRKRGDTLDSILERLSRKKDPFFRQLKDLVIEGYYTSKEGLVQELGWHGYTALSEFPGCTHPGHKGE